MALPAITLRNTKGSALTHTEMDTNLTNLQQANIQVTAAGTTTNIALGGGFTLSAGANIGLTNTAGNITITNTQAAGGGGGLANVVEDLTPQLGGNLDVNGFNINGVNFSLGNILLAENKGIYADSGLVIGSDDVILGAGDSGVTPEVAITTVGGQGLFFDTNQGVNTGSFVISAGVNANIEITPNGLGRTVITNATLDNPDITNITSVNKVTITAPATSATLTIANGKTLTASNTITLAGTDSTVMTFPPTSSTIGYLNMPQVNLTAFTGTRGFILSDSGKHIYTYDGGETLSIPVDSNIAFPLGTVITVVNHSTVNVAINPGAVSLYLAGNSSAGSRTITSHGVATLIKVAGDSWFINGTGVV